MSGIFNAAIFNNAVFNTGTGVSPPVIVVKTGTGGIDPRRKRKTLSIYKPTGLPPYREIGRKDIQARVDDSKQIQAEIAGRLLREFTEETKTLAKPVEAMTAKEVDREIAYLMKEKLDKIDEEETMMVLMMALDD